MGDRGLWIHDMKAGVNEPWMGAIAEVPEGFREEVKESLATIVGDTYAASAGMDDNLVFARIQYWEFIWDKMDSCLASFKEEGKVIDYTMVKGRYGLFLGHGWAKGMFEEE